MENVRSQVQSLSSSIRSILMLNCGGLFNLEDYLDVSEEVTVYVLDSRRPINLRNAFWNNEVIVFHETDLDKELMAEKEAIIYTEEHEYEPRNGNGWESDDEDIDASNDDDSDGDDDYSHDDNNRRQRRRTGVNTEVIPENINRKWKESRAVVIDYMSKGSVYGTSISNQTYMMATQLDRTSTDILWLAIVGLTSQYINDYIGHKDYLDIVQIYKDESERLVQNVRQLRTNASVMSDELNVGSASVASDDGFIKCTEEYRFMMVRHWSLYESMYHSNYVASRLGIWREPGRKRLQALLAKMGRPQLTYAYSFSLEECNQVFAHMSIDLKRILKDRLESVAPEYGLNEILYTSFTRSYGYRGVMSASDVVYSVTSLLESSPEALVALGYRSERIAEDTLGIGPGTNMNGEQEEASGAPSWWHTNFFKACDSLDFGGGEDDQLRQGLRLCMETQKAVVRQAEYGSKKAGYRPISLVLAVLKEETQTFVVTGVHGSPVIGEVIPNLHYLRQKAMSFIPNLTYSIASTVWSGTSAALGKGHPGKGSTTTTVAGPGSIHHHHSSHNHHHHSHSHSHHSNSNSASSTNSSNGPNGPNGPNSKRYSHSRRHSNTNYNFSRSHPNGPANSSSSSPMTPPHSPSHYSQSGASDRRSTRKRNPSISSMPRTPPSSPQLDNSSAFETHSSTYNFSRKRSYMDNTGSSGHGSSRPSSYHGSAHSNYYNKSSTQTEGTAGIKKNSSNPKESNPKAPTTPEERYRVVDDILETENLYRVLAVSRTATSEEIRRAYIAKSRVCHPDKFPEYPRATEAFQKLSLAYETLSKPSSRFVYDSTGGSSGRTMLGSEETLQSVLSQVFFEFMDGDFEVIRNMINTMNNTAGGVRLGDDAIGVIEDMFLRLRFVLHGCKKYMSLVHEQVQQLSEIHHSMRSLAYLDVLGRFRLTLKLSKVMLTIPMIIQDEMKREIAVAAALEGSTEQEDIGGKKNAGIVENVFLNDRVETVLKKVVSAIETGERWV
ncbi:hypothetical protein BGX27_009575 [Mortierella sp. AM989]|nr:hypothetical protein BGX27_009575 [Mortierella sp. AM989]